MIDNTKYLLVDFDNKKPLLIEFLHDDEVCTSAEDLNRNKNKNFCPFKNDTSKKKWCGLLATTKTVTKFFSEIESTEIGELCIVKNGQKIIFKSDAQGIITYIFLTCFQVYKCSALEGLTDFSQYYSISKDPEVFLCKIISSQLTRNFVSGKKDLKGIEKDIKKELKQIQTHLDNFMKNLDKTSSKDSMKNSMVMLHGLAEIVKFDLKDVRKILAKNINSV